MRENPDSNAIESLRYEVVKDMMKLGTIVRAWDVWKPKIQYYINPNNSITTIQLKKLGDNLQDIFSSTSAGTRSQAEVSSGGTGWEVLVCWYLNLCLLGSNTVVVKAKKEHIPSAISDSITVMYGTTPSNTESDLLAITFPDSNLLKSGFSGSKRKLKDLFDSEVTSKFNKTSLTIIQCKTNWNDNAQVPMLWDMIYNSTGLRSASVGRHGFTPQKLKHFDYAFVTVPTTNPNKIKTSSVCVLRVRNLSGGNYWGLPSSSGIAMNISEMLNKNFQESLNSYANGWHNDITQLLASQIASWDYFRLK